MGQDTTKNKKHSIDLENNCLIVICCWAEGLRWVVDSIPIALTGDTGQATQARRLRQSQNLFLSGTQLQAPHIIPEKLFEVCSDITADLSAETKLKLELQ